MTRLIPDEINKDLKKEYKFRFFTTVCFMLSLMIIINLAFVSSSYLLLYLYEKAYVTNGSGSNNESIKLYEQITQKIEELYVLSGKINQVNQKSDLHLVENLFINPPRGISIQALEMTSDSQMTIRGIADTREDILVFQNIMKQNPVFKDFSIPIESLARQKDIAFNVTLTYYEN